MKYTFTPENDKLITGIYNTTSKRDGRITKLAKYLGIPRRTVYQRARRLGVYQPRIDHVPWSDEEVGLLERNAWKTPETIQKCLKKEGFQRSIPAIILKKKRARIMPNQEGYNATQVAEGLGVDLHIVTQWIGRGFLKAEKRGSNRVNDIWYLKDKAVKTFIINHIGIIDIRRVEKIWFVDVLIN
jgi:hypothetical protein